MAWALKRHGRHGGQTAAGQEVEAGRTGAGPDEQVERQAPDTPADLPKGSWATVLKGTLKEFKKDELADRAAALTYYGILALFPALLALISLLGVVGQSATKQVLDNIQKLAPGAARDVLSNAVKQMQGNTGIGSIVAIVGLALAVWSASGYVAAFIRSTNAVYDVPEGRPAWKVLPVRVGVTVVLMIMVESTRFLSPPSLILRLTCGFARRVGAWRAAGSRSRSVTGGCCSR